MEFGLCRDSRSSIAYSEPDARRLPSAVVFQAMEFGDWTGEGMAFAFSFSLSLGGSAFPTPLRTCIAPFLPSFAFCAASCPACRSARDMGEGWGAAAGFSSTTDLGTPAEVGGSGFLFSCVTGATAGAGTGAFEGVPAGVVRAGVPPSW